MSPAFVGPGDRRRPRAAVDLVGSRLSKDPFCWHHAGVGESWLRLIPTDPSWTPATPAQATAVTLLQGIAPCAEVIRAVSYDTTTFIDAGSNFEAMSCLVCGQDVPVAWWAAKMQHGSETSFSDLTVEMACCRSVLSLNDIRYDWPQGFCRWALDARSPGRGKLTDAELAALAAGVGHELREVWTRL